MVEDTQKPLDGLVVHRGVVQSGSIAVGTAVVLGVDSVRRDATRRNHSATHLLHYALRKVVGPQAQQKGSLVGPERLRFDFTYGSALSDAQLTEIEDTVNHLIVENHAVRTQVLPLDQARSLGAMMIFEEKYGATVRMLTMGPSTELCGGTHARATGDVGLFKILQEQGVAAGIRRIVATTSAGTGAPADVTRFSVGSGCPKPASTRISAGEPNSWSTPNRAIASCSLRGSARAGRVGSMSGTTELTPSAGSNSANGGNVGRSTPPGAMPNASRSIATCATKCRWR